MIDARRILTLAAALAITGGVSLAAGTDPEPVESGRSGGQQPIQAVDADQRAAYAVLRRPTTAQDRLRDQAVGFVKEAMTRDNGAAPGLARRAQVTASNAALYVIPAKGFVCLYITAVGTDEGNATCNNSEEALRGHILGIDWPTPGVTRVYGLATDDVTEVRLRFRDGSAIRAEPVGNTFVFESDRYPTQVEWGDRMFPIPAGMNE